MGGGALILGGKGYLPAWWRGWEADWVVAAGRGICLGVFQSGVRL